MKQLQRIMLVTLAAVSLGLVAASTASATTLEVGAVKRNEAVTFSTTLKAGSSLLIEDTGGFFANTCGASTINGSTTAFTGPTAGGPISSLTFSSCKESPIVVDGAGSLTIENVAGTTNGTVRSIGAKWTTPSPFGTLTCVTAASPGTDLGTLTGVKEGNATLEINASLNCGAITAKYTMTYTVTSPVGLGVTS
jgi:hypothetical protein